MSNIFSQLLQEGERQQQQLNLKAVVPSPVVTESQRSTINHDSTTARQHPVTTVRQHNAMTARQHDSASSYIRAFLDSKASQKTTLRYSPSLMTDIDDVIYQIRKTYGITLSKNEIFIAALANILFDFRRNADHSVLANELIQHKKE